MWKCPHHDGIDPSCPDCKTWLDSHALAKTKAGFPEDRAGHPLITQDSIRYKKIIDYSDAELEFAIKDAVEHAATPNRIQVNAREHRSSLDFWRLLRGFDAYMEKRRRKNDPIVPKTPHPDELRHPHTPAARKR